MTLHQLAGAEPPLSAEYLFPKTVDEALHILAAWEGEARIIAGGTDLMLEVGKKIPPPRCLVSTEKIQGLEEIKVEEDFITIGAAVTFSNLKDHPYISSHVHVLADAARSVGSLAIQNVATLAGNIVNAMPAADGTVAAIALEAEACVAGPGQAEWIPVESLCLGPGKSRVDPTRQLVTHLRFPCHNMGWGTAWIRLGRRPSLTLPVLNCAVNVLLEASGLAINHARIVVGPVAPRPFRALEAEKFLQDSEPSDENIKQAAGIAREESDPRGNILRASKEYRLATIPVIVEEALYTACARAQR